MYGRIIVFALLYKDFLVLRKEKLLWLMFFMALIGGVISGARPNPALFLFLWPVYSVLAYSNSYDFKYMAETILASLPVPRSAIVIEKYALGLVAALISSVLAILFGLPLTAFHLVAGSFRWGFPFVAFALCAVFSGFSLASYFCFGYMKSRYVPILLFVLPSVVIGALEGNTASISATPAAEKIMLDLLESAPAVFSILGASLAFLALCCLYSIRAYAKKEF